MAVWPCRRPRASAALLSTPLSCDGALATYFAHDRSGVRHIVNALSAILESGS